MIGQVKSAAIQIILLGLYDDLENKKNKFTVAGKHSKSLLMLYLFTI